MSFLKLKSFRKFKIHLFYSSSNTQQQQRQQQLIDEIEKWILSINNSLISDKLEITVPYKLTWDNCSFNNERLALFEFTLKIYQRYSNVFTEYV